MGRYSHLLEAHDWVHRASLEAHKRAIRWRAFECGVLVGAVAVALIEVAWRLGLFGH